jgi:MFS family permease
MVRPGLGGVAGAAGPLIGGYLIAAASWRWIFFINLPFAAVVVVLGGRHIPESRDPSVTGRLDYAGALAAVIFLTGVTFAFIEAPALGWASPAVLTMVLLGVTGLAALLVREHRAAAPMLPLSIFRERQFAAASAVTFIVYAALTGATFLLPVVLQVVSGYSPFRSGLALLPLTVIMLALSARSGQLAARIGPLLQLTAGPILVGIGLAMLTFSTSGSSYVSYVLPAVVVFGFGLAITVAPLTATAMNSAPARHAGVASAINNDLARFGGLLAVAILPALAGITGRAYLHPDALAAGFRIAVLVSGAVCAAGGLLAAVTITDPPRSPEAEGAPAAGAPGAEVVPAPERVLTARRVAAAGQCLHCGLDAPPLTTGSTYPASRLRVGRPAQAG